jgi:hypothetical protein
MVARQSDMKRSQKASRFKLITFRRTEIITSHQPTSATPRGAMVLGPR